MPSMQIIKRRIASVRSTQQITKAMDLVSASKLQKAKLRLDASRPFFNELTRVIDHLRKSENVSGNIFIQPREVVNVAYVVITSDRGLCGGYNINVAKEALKAVEAGNADGKNEKIIAVGAKGWDYFRRRKKNIIRKYTGMAETSFSKDAEAIGSYLASLYESGEIDEAYVAYTKFESSLSHVPHVEKLLPIAGVSDSEYPEYDFMEYDPDVNTVLDYLVPMYMRTFIYGAMMESGTCEQAARMVSMDAATNNADEIIDNLTLVYNRIRQGAITQELNEIVSGANALK